MDEETNKIYETARQSKNIQKKDDIVRKNLSQLLNFNDDFRQNNLRQKNTEWSSQGLDKSPSSRDLQCGEQTLKTEQEQDEMDDKNFINSIQDKIKRTKQFIDQMEVCSCKDARPEHVIKVQQKLER